MHVKREILDWSIPTQVLSWIKSYIFRAIVTFGLNALRGRHRTQRDKWGGEWDSTNAWDFINYTISKGYAIDSWEFGKRL